MKQKLLQIAKNEMISQDHFDFLKHRLESLGFTSGTDVEVLKKISFENVVIVRIFQTIIALNKSEFLCLKF